MLLPQEKRCMMALMTKLDFAILSLTMTRQKYEDCLSSVNTRHNYVIIVLYLEYMCAHGMSR